MAAVTRVSSLDQLGNELQARNITATDQVNEVRIELAEEASLHDSAMMKVKTRPGREGFILVNPELLECKYLAKMMMETSMNRVFDGTFQWMNQELQSIGDSIAALKVLVELPDNQVPQHGPPLDQRNRGVQHAIYPCPPFPSYPEFEHADHYHRVPYQNAYADPAARAAAAVRDRRAQRAVWRANLRILERRKSVLEKAKLDMCDVMRTELRTVMQEPTELGVGYADYENPPLA